MVGIKGRRTEIVGRIGAISVPAFPKSLAYLPRMLHSGSSVGSN